MKTFTWASILLTFLSTAFPETDSIELANGKTVHGVLSGRQSTYVALTISEGQSKAEIRLNPDEIVCIHFSDSDQKYEAIKQYPASDPYQTTILLESLVRKRLPYLELLSHSDETLFAMLLESYIQSGRASDALDRAKLWRTKLRENEVIDQLDELQIVAAKNVGELDEAVFYSKRWIDSGKSASRTALPWCVLAEKSLREGQTEDALWLALNPIVFTNPNTPRFIESAYEIAVFSAYQLNNYKYALQLYTDMKLRKLNWPIDSDKADILTKLENHDTIQSSNPWFEENSSSNASNELLKVVGAP